MSKTTSFILADYTFDRLPEEKQELIDAVVERKLRTATLASTLEIYAMPVEYRSGLRAASSKDLLVNLPSRATGRATRAGARWRCTPQH